MLDFLSMEAELGRDLGEYTYAESVQMFCENSRAKWQHTAAVIAHVVASSVNCKSIGSIKPESFNPWERQSNSTKISLNSKEAFQQLRHLTTNGKFQP